MLVYGIIILELDPRLLDVVITISPGGCFLGEYLKTIVFFDGQNLYHSAKDAWRGPVTSSSSRYTWPSYDVEKLATALTSKTPGRTIAQIRFYTGVPDSNQDPFWHYFWVSKLRYLRSRGVEVYNGRINSSQQEKGVDVKLAIDMIRLTYEKQYEVAIIVSQDWDFGPAVRLAKEIAIDQSRQLVFESHFPVGPGSHSDRGIPGTIWLPIDQTTYDACYDSRDYRRPRTS